MDAARTKPARAFWCPMSRQQLPGGMAMNERVERARAALQAHDLSMALLSSPHNVCYVSGYEVPIEVGPGPFAGGPSLVVLDTDGHVTLIVPHLDEEAAPAHAHAD